MRAVGEHDERAGRVGAAAGARRRRSVGARSRPWTSSQARAGGASTARGRLDQRARAASGVGDAARRAQRCPRAPGSRRRRRGRGRGRRCAIHDRRGRRDGRRAGLVVLGARRSRRSGTTPSATIRALAVDVGDERVERAHALRQAAPRPRPLLGGQHPRDRVDEERSRCRRRSGTQARHGGRRRRWRSLIARRSGRSTPARAARDVRPPARRCGVDRLVAWRPGSRAVGRPWRVSGGAVTPATMPGVADVHARAVAGGAPVSVATAAGRSLVGEVGRVGVGDWRRAARVGGTVRVEAWARAVPRRVTGALWWTALPLFSSPRGSEQFAASRAPCVVRRRPRGGRFGPASRSGSFRRPIWSPKCPGLLIGHRIRTSVTVPGTSTGHIAVNVPGTTGESSLRPRTARRRAPADDTRQSATPAHCSLLSVRKAVARPPPPNAHTSGAATDAHARRRRTRHRRSTTPVPDASTPWPPHSAPGAGGRHLRPRLRQDAGPMDVRGGRFDVAGTLAMPEDRDAWLAGATGVARAGAAGGRRGAGRRAGARGAARRAVPGERARRAAATSTTTVTPARGPTARRTPGCWPPRRRCPTRGWRPRCTSASSRPRAGSPTPTRRRRWRRCASAGVRVAAVSNVGFDLRPVLDGLGLLEHLDAVVLSYEVGAVKPDAADLRRRPVPRSGSRPPRRSWSATTPRPTAAPRTPASRRC